MKMKRNVLNVWSKRGKGDKEKVLKVQRGESQQRNNEIENIKVETTPKRDKRILII